MRYYIAISYLKCLTLPDLDWFDLKCGVFESAVIMYFNRAYGTKPRPIVYRSHLMLYQDLREQTEAENHAGFLLSLRVPQWCASYAGL